LALDLTLALELTLLVAVVVVVVPVAGGALRYGPQKAEAPSAAMYSPLT
jgi:hypothetical protein